MKLSMAYFFDQHKDKIAIAQQLGVTSAVVNASRKGEKVPEDGTWDFTAFQTKVDVFRQNGIKVDVVESPTPLELTKLGLEGRDQEIEVFLSLLKIMDQLDIRTVCYNWMPVIGWYRSITDIPARGGATVTGYRHKMVEELPLTEYGEVSAQHLWENLHYFLKAVVPEAEKYHVRLAVHPDDPPVSSIRGISRILINADAFQRVIDMVPSPYNGITLCQGSFAAMGEDPKEMIRHFGERKKIFFAHFRDIRGHAEDFYETFHDDGQTDMYACMKEYYRIGFDGCIRPDHVPTMLGEKNVNPGYSVMGNLYAVGYMKGLMTAAEREVCGCQANS